MLVNKDVLVLANGLEDDVLVEKKEYFCMCCKKWILDDDMVFYSGKTKKGFCRECNKKYSYEEKKEIEEVGFYQGEQLSFI